MADYQSCGLLGTMDRLCFHHTVLFPEPSSLFSTKCLKPQVISLSISIPEEESASPNEHEQNLSHSFPDDSTSTSEEEETEMIKKERPPRLNFIHSNSCSHLSSSTGSKNSRLRKSRSYKSFGEFELEEFQGFIDLGFVFEEEHLIPRMITGVPGLQRLGLHENKKSEGVDVMEAVTGDDVMEGDRERPYLSEAWHIKRPNSPPVNLRVPKVFAAADIKKHIRLWAKTVCLCCSAGIMTCICKLCCG